MKRWFKYIKPYTLYFILGPLCMLVEVAGGGRKGETLLVDGNSHGKPS